MPELAERRFSARIDQERDQQELTHLGEVEGFIQKRAAQFSRDDPMLAEDLAQQARTRLDSTRIQMAFLSTKGHEETQKLKKN